MKLTINHLTHYRYDHEVKFSTQYLRLTPQNTPRQQILEWSLTLPEQATLSTDGFGNLLHVLTLDRPHEMIAIHARGVVAIADQPAALAEQCGPLSPLVFLRSSPLTEADEAIRAFAARYYRDTNPEASLRELMAELRLRMPYTPGATQVWDSAAQVFAAGHGVCQDHAHVFLACCRSLAIPARYVSGYIYTEDTKHVAMHAWVEVWLGASWQSFDITNNTCNPNQHLKLAVGFDYLDACPIRGSRVGGGYEEMFSQATVEQTEDAQAGAQQQ
ncbi:transglutaminase family protein [Biostraticola tofi]|uniref:Transglutaminase-like putative cysteine protease n=1 Tax=Biostraticola tofi TaxID=466109 RepID=A0A4R3YJP9_9GAMM|nr:transglutaminase family protein [Biostraticola tofi]TCV92466.1 transglutaminase-like putative cysteine protease [Biostraticola tofi]